MKKMDRKKALKRRSTYTPEMQRGDAGGNSP
jgi:hypothetical protein